MSTTFPPWWRPWSHRSSRRSTTTPSWYGRFLARARWDTLAADVLAEHPAASSVRDVNRRLQRQLAEVPPDLRHARIDQLHTLLVGTVAGWEWARDRHERHLPPATLTADLTATGLAVLTAPLPEAVRRIAAP